MPTKPEAAHPPRGIPVGDNHHGACPSPGAPAQVGCSVGTPSGLTASVDPGFAINEAGVIHRRPCPERAGAHSATPSVPERDPRSGKDCHA